jgi:hypothetical protein
VIFITAAITPATAADSPRLVVNPTIKGLTNMELDI